MESKDLKDKLEQIAQKLKEGVPYEDLEEDLNDTLGIETSDPNEGMDREWVETYCNK